MRNKHCRDKVVSARFLARFLAKLQAPIAPVIDLNKLTQHAAIRVRGVDSIDLNVEICSNMPLPSTNITHLNTILSEYAAAVKHVSMRIHSPLPQFESSGSFTYRMKAMKKLFKILDTFKLTSLNINMYLDIYNFPQMKLCAAVYGMKFRRWSLAYKVYESEQDFIRVQRGSEFDLRLRRVYKKEVKSLV